MSIAKTILIITIIAIIGVITTFGILYWKNDKNNVKQDEYSIVLEQLEDTSTALNTATNERNNLQVLYDETSENIAEIRLDITALENADGDNATTIAELQKELQKQEAQQTELGEQLSDIDARITDLQAEYDDLLAQYVSLSNSLSTYHKKVESLWSLDDWRIMNTLSTIRDINTIGAYPREIFITCEKFRCPIAYKDNTTINVEDIATMIDNSYYEFDNIFMRTTRFGGTGAGIIELFTLQGDYILFYGVNISTMLVDCQVSGTVAISYFK